MKRAVQPSHPFLPPAPLLFSPRSLQQRRAQRHEGELGVQLRLQLHASAVHLHEERRDLLGLEHRERLDGVRECLSLDSFHLLLADRES